MTPGHNVNRRQFLTRGAAGVGALSLAQLAGGEALGAAGKAGAGSAGDGAAHPLAARQPHFQPRAKRVIMLFMTGGVSHIETFDPKPLLNERSGDEIRRGKVAYGSRWAFKRYGRSGLPVSDLFPNIGRCADDLCVIRSMVGDAGDHFQATLGMHTGSTTFALPGIGAWVSYGLGTLNINLPSHVVFAARLPYSGKQVFDSNFLPAYHQGTRIMPGKTPVRNATPVVGDQSLRRLEFDLLREVNERHFAARSQDSQLAGRLQSFATAQGLQQQVPELFDLKEENDHTLDLYGVKRGDNRSFGWQCLMARRLAERGVRFIELVDTGASGNWDSHGNMKAHEPLARKVDRPIHGLIRDLDQRGLLDDTLIVWCTEFGRTPLNKDKNERGRGHHAKAFTCWLAGGGVKGGHVHGQTDEFGEKVVKDTVRVHDFHATILHILGMDHERLTYHHAGRDFRLTDVHGHVVKDVLA